MVSAIVPLLPVLPVRSGVNLFNSTWRQCAEVVEVNLLPSVLDFYGADEVGSWFRRRGLRHQRRDRGALAHRRLALHGGNESTVPFDRPFRKVRVCREPR